MDSFELNKIIGAILGTLLFVITFLSNTIGQWVIHSMQKRMEGAAR